MSLAEELPREGMWITYEDGTVVELPPPPTSLLHAAPWVDMLIALFDPDPQGGS